MNCSNGQNGNILKVNGVVLSIILKGISGSSFCWETLCTLKASAV